jgi:hypothetical protein
MTLGCEWLASGYDSRRMPNGGAVNGKAASVGGLAHSSSFALKLRPGYHSFKPTFRDPLRVGTAEFIAP